MPNFVKALKFNITIALILIAELCIAQNVNLIDFCGLRPVVISDQVPENLTSSRSAVIISMPDLPDEPGKRRKWEKFAKMLHADLRKMYIDPVCYVYKDDLLAGPEVKNAFISTFKDRAVKNIIIAEQTFVGLDEAYNLKIAKFNDRADLIAEKELVWMQKEAPMDLITLRLGRQILRQNVERTNFLIPEGPHLIKDLPVFSGIQLSSYPGQIRRANLAVIIPEKISVNSELSASDIQLIENRNLEIDQKINEIKSIMSLYPYKYELVSFGDDETLYKKGFQFALFPFYSTGETIKNMLNYKVTGTETDYISMIPKDSSGVSLKTIPVDQLVYKYYIKQTIAHDVYVGKEWDSDFTWEGAMRNFILNLRQGLR